MKGEIKMETSRNFLKAIALALTLASLMLVATPVHPVKAQLAEQQPSITVPSGVTPDIVVPTTALMSVRPTVVGLNQIVLVNLFPLPAPNANRKFKDLKVTITKPDGSQEVVKMDSYPADGTAWFEWIMDKAGTWHFKFDFPGIYYPAGRYYNGYIVTNTSGSLYTQSAYYQPSSSKVMNVTVLENYVAPSWPQMPLPTDYWTRPVPYEYREWWPIAGNWPWHGPAGESYGLARELWDELYPNTNPYYGGYSGAAGVTPGMFGAHSGYFTPWVQGPNSPHVVWKRQYAIAGIIGGDYGIEISDVNIFSASGLGRFPQIIYAGRAYHAYAKPGSGKTAVTYWMCYDIRTGEVFWERPLATGESAPTVIEYFNQGLLPGGQVTGAQTHVTAVYFLSISGGYLRKYDPWTGAMVGNYSIAPLTTGYYYRNGYALSVQSLGGGNYRLINWTTFGTSTTLTARIRNNVTWPWSSLPGTTDFNVGISALVTKNMVGGAPANTTIRAASLKDGTVLWTQTIPEWEYSGSCDYADHGKIAVLTEQGYFVALNLNDGTLAWKSDPMEYPWDTGGFGAYNVLSAYGLLYRNGYAAVYAFNWTNGKIAWKYHSPAATPYETPYIDENGNPVYSTNIGGAIADGKYYIYNTEHSATVPITRGWELHCLNATTGKLLWKVGIPGAASKHTTDIGPIADGYLTLASSDGYMYVFGKGKSQTTVTASPKTSAKGSQVLIEGTVLDMSPAQPGTPCVSKESMATWMEYLHKQMPMNGLWGNETITGVPVTLTACKDGKVIDLGTVTTNGYYGTFSFAWTPPEEGTYTIIASFAGDDSYGSSAAATAITVGPPPKEIEIPETPEIPTPTDYTPMLTALAIAIIVVAILVVYDIITVRKLRK